MLAKSFRRSANLKLPKHFAFVGSSTIRSDGVPKVTGQTHYTADYSLPGMIWGKCLRSPHPHARIIRIDTHRAKKVRGVLAVLTASDLPDRLIGIKMKDMPILAKDRVRFIGERVAVVGAESIEIAEEALSLITVEYADLPAVHDPLQAMSPNAPIIHEALRSYQGLRLPLPEIPNVHSYIQWQQGNCEKGLSESDFVFEQAFNTQRVHQGYLEPHAAIVQIDTSGRAIIRAPAKQAYVNRENLSEWLGLDQKNIVFQLGSIGGDFGGKNTLMDIPLCYCLAKVTARPVKMVMSYFEELTAAHPRHASVITIKTGVKKDGRLWARDFKAVFNGGAYAAIKENDTINLPGARHGNGAYHIPHFTIQAFSVYTNSTPSGIMRGPGDAQVNFAVESHMDYIADKLGIEPCDFRHRNVLKRGAILPHGICLNSDMGTRVLEVMGRKLRSIASRKKRPYVGRGFALGFRDVNFGEANIEVGIREDGTAYILTTVPDTGTGAHTIFRQIVAEVLGIPPEGIEVILGTTDTFPTDLRVIASLVTYLGGQAIQKAALALRDCMIETAAFHFKCFPPEIHLTQDVVLGPAKRKLQLSELASLAILSEKPLVARGTFTVKERTGASCFFAQGAEVEIDPETGQVRVRKVISAHDVATIINPITHQGQVDGGTIQGFGFALIENLIEDNGNILTTNLGEYKLPNICDIPEHEMFHVRDREGPGPFQAKPVGEHGAIPMAAAIANAVYDAIGVQIRDLPITAENVYVAMQKRRMPMRGSRESKRTAVS